MSWQQVGKNCLHREGVAGSNRGLSALISTSEAASQTQDIWVDGEVRQLKECKYCPVLTLMYDATPARMGLGLLDSKHIQWARFPVLKPDGKWKLVSYQNYVSQFPRRRIRFGVLDMLASGCRVHYTDDQERQGGFKILLRAQVMESKDASCLHKCKSITLTFHTPANL